MVAFLGDKRSLMWINPLSSARPPHPQSPDNLFFAVWGECQPFLDVFRDTKLNEFRIFSDPSFTMVSITKLETEGPVWWTQNT